MDSQQGLEDFNEQDRILPVANVARVMRDALPPGIKISNSAKDLANAATSEFVAFVTSEAYDRCKRDGRKTLSGDDLISAFHALGFDNYAIVLAKYLEQYKKYNSKD